jgi:Mn-containing catalase
MENSMAASDNKNILDALEANWQAEMEGFHTYTALSNREADPHRRNALRGLAMAEKHHADLWAERIKELGGQSHGSGGIRMGKRIRWRTASVEQTWRFVGWKSMKDGILQSTVSKSKSLVTSRALLSSKR